MDEVTRPQSAAVLRRLAGSRDPAAWEALLEHHGAEILAACRRILGDEALAEDACQETLLLIRDRAVQFRGFGASEDLAARAWVLRAACTTALQLRRKRRAGLHREERYARERSRVAPDFAEAQGMDEERAGTVRREVAGLPEADRLPLVLHYYGGLEYAELASTLGCPVGTAKARVSRGLEKLRRRLALLGLILASGQLAELLREPSALAAAAESAANAQQMAAWKALLTSSRQPAIPGSEMALENGGLSLMTKLGIGAAALVLLGLLAFGVARSNGADAPAKEPGPAAGVASARPAPTPPKETRGPPSAPAAAATEAEKKAAVEGCNAFAFDLYAKLCETEKGNLFFSPYSVSTALAMTYAGARGNTEAEMAKALHFTLGQERLHAAFGALLQAQNAPEKDGKKRGFALAVANRLWGQKGYRFLDDFLTLTKTSYGAGLEALDFEKATEEARQTINTWVEKQTQEKIKGLIQPGALDKLVRLVLTNAVYFKGDWERAFRKERTKSEPFHLAGGQAPEVPLMNQQAHFKYLEVEKQFQALELPYVNKELSMVLFLPAQTEGLAGLQAALTPAQLNKWLGAMHETEVQVALPRFKITWGTQDLKDPLEKLGMRDAFLPRQANFSGMTADPLGLYISKILHKAFVDVNEQGTEAAAATVVIMIPQGESSPPKVFKADRPFLFLIREKATGSHLFMGRVVDPRG